MGQFGLIGKNIDYSFSREFFSRKFELESLPHTYKNFNIKEVEALTHFFENLPDVLGLNVTIPYKEAVIPFLDRLDKEAKKIGAVNTIKFTKKGELVGYNTDHYGFAKALVECYPISQKRALILGTGGASKAIKYVFDAFNITHKTVSRSPEEDQLGYDQLDKVTLREQGIIVNCTPLGTYPDVDLAPPIPYQFLTKNQLLFDLVYNPSITQFMKKGAAHGASTSNGKNMLIYQAQKAWKIWNS